MSFLAMTGCDMRFSKGFLKEFFIALHPWVKRSKFGLDRSSHNEQCSKIRINLSQRKFNKC